MSTRRDFLSAAVVAAVSGAATKSWSQEPTTDAHADLMKGWHGDEEIAMVVYDGFTALDLFGPHHMFILMNGAKINLVSATLDPVATDGTQIQPTMTFDDCPDDLTVLFVPGGSSGTLNAMKNDVIVDFLADRGKKAEWVASVCTGSLLLGAAGLLDGYKATSHWLSREVLAEFGATPVNERVVVDRNRITGAGVTAGIDLGLSLAGKFRGDAYAQGCQLFAEYDPAPPYDAGSEEKAPAAITAMLRGMHTSFNDSALAIAKSRRGRK